MTNQTHQEERIPLVRVRDVKTHFPRSGGVLARTVRYVKAVDGVSFDIHRGETLGLVGESGCGKTTLGRTILRLIPATAGSVSFDGTDVLAAGRKELRAMRRRMQIVFQDPVSSLNPRMTVESIVGEPLKIHGMARGSALRSRVAELLERVGLSPSHMTRYPHEFSGGQKQRVGIARALCLQPSFLVCDEPVSALDVSIQSQILNLLADLREEYGLSYLFIAHNLAVVRHFCDRVAVMYAGKIVEVGSCDDICDCPRHPYTQALLASIPHPDPTDRRDRVPLPGEPADPIDPPAGCAFHPRCARATDECSRSTPVLEHRPQWRGGHYAACFLADEEAASSGIVRP